MKPMTAAEWMDADPMRQGMDGKWPLNVMDAYAAYRVRAALEEAAQAVGDAVVSSTDELHGTECTNNYVRDIIRALMPEGK